MWLRPIPPGSPSMLPRWQPKQLMPCVYVSRAEFARMFVPTPLLPVGGTPNGVHVAPVMKYLLRMSLPGTCAVLWMEITWVLEDVLLPGIPHGLSRRVSLGLTVPGTGGLQLPGGCTALMLPFVRSTVMCMQLKSPLELVADSSHVPAVV